MIVLAARSHCCSQATPLRIHLSSTASTGDNAVFSSPSFAQPIAQPQQSMTITHVYTARVPMQGLLQRVYYHQPVDYTDKLYLRQVFVPKRACHYAVRYVHVTFKDAMPNPRPPPDYEQNKDQYYITFNGVRLSSKQRKWLETPIGADEHQFEILMSMYREYNHLSYKFDLSEKDYANNFLHMTVEQTRPMFAARLTLAPFPLDERGLNIQQVVMDRVESFNRIAVLELQLVQCYVDIQPSISQISKMIAMAYERAELWFPLGVDGKYDEGLFAGYFPRPPPPPSQPSNNSNNNSASSANANNSNGSSSSSSSFSSTSTGGSSASGGNTDNNANNQVSEQSSSHSTAHASHTTVAASLPPSATEDKRRAFMATFSPSSMHAPDKNSREAVRLSDECRLLTPHMMRVLQSMIKCSGKVSLSDAHAHSKLII